MRRSGKLGHRATRYFVKQLPCGFEFDHAQSKIQFIDPLLFDGIVVVLRPQMDASLGDRQVVGLLCKLVSWFQAHVNLLMVSGLKFVIFSVAY